MLKKLLLSFTISIFLFAFAKAQEEAIPKEIKLQSDLIEAFKLEQIGKTDKAIELLEKLSIEAEEKKEKERKQKEGMAKAKAEDDAEAKALADNGRNNQRKQ